MMTELRKINLQLFADGETNQNEVKGTDTQGKEGFSIRKAFGLPEKEPAKATEPTEKPVEKEAKEEPKQEEPVKEPEFDEILYNKQKVKIPVTERQTYLQKGYNYDKVKAEADTAKATLKKIAQAEGFDTVEKYLADLDNREKAKLAEKIEEAVGDPDKINEIVENHPLVKQTKEEKRKLEFEKVKSEIAKDRFFKDLEEQFNGLVDANPGTDPKLIYKIIRSDYLTEDKLAEITAKEREAAEKKAIADAHDKEKRSTPTGGDTGDGKNVVQPTDFTKKLSEIFGVSPQKVAQRIYEKTKRS